MKRLFVLATLLFCTSAYAQQPLNVWIKMPSTITQDGLVAGTTNLPDGTILSLGIRARPGFVWHLDPACTADYSVRVAVVHGAFGPVGLPILECLPQGDYAWDIVMQASFMQPPHVIAIIGKTGDGVAGPLVKRDSRSDILGPNVEAIIPMTLEGAQ